MEKKELIEQAATRSGMTKKDLQTALKAILETIEDSLSKGEPVKFTGFGTFEVRERAAREGRNPSTGEKITIAATKVAAFKPGATLKEAVKD